MLYIAAYCLYPVSPYTPFLKTSVLNKGAFARQRPKRVGVYIYSFLLF